MSEPQIYEGIVKKMKEEEIKEILKDLQEDIENNILIEVRGNYFKPLLDYITNLQQENERLKELDENYPIEEELAEAYRREENYKSRIEKAVNKIYNLKIHVQSFGDKIPCWIDELENILNGKE